MKKVFLCLVMLCLLALTACSRSGQSGADNQEKYSEFTKSFIAMVDGNEQVKAMLEEGIAICKDINPDPQSNPVQTLEQYYDFVEWSTKCMPWDIAPQPEGRPLLNRIDQSLNYFYWLVDQPLDCLMDSDYYRPTLQYHEPFRSWLIAYTKEWGSYLSTEASWNEEYLQLAKDNADFGLQNGWYEDPSLWHSFNDFFSRRLASPEMRPIAEPDNAAIVCSPADSDPQGLWEIDEEGCFVLDEGVAIKSRRFYSTQELLGESAYKDAFCGGTMTHTFLNVHDYHRYHFPVSGIVRELLTIPGDDALGGKIVFDAPTKTYQLWCDEPTWQAIETRTVAMVETEEYGMVALLPIGMSQVCSCMWEEGLAVGQSVKKGYPLGYFLFGGSDFVILFEKGVNVEMLAPQEDGDYKHILMGEPLCRISKK